MMPATSLPQALRTGSDTGPSPGGAGGGKNQRPHTLLEYRVAVALNNKAVTMMERSCFTQAYETFKDAVNAMKQAANVVAGRRHAEEPGGKSRCGLMRMLDQANKRAAQPQVAHLRLSSPPTLPSSNANLSAVAGSAPTMGDHHHNIIDDDMSDQGDPPSQQSRPSKKARLSNDFQLDTAVNDPTAVAPPPHVILRVSPTYTLVRMETDEEWLGLEEEDSELAIIILLYNTGVSYLCQSQVVLETVASKPGLANALLGGGLRIMGFCSNLLQTRRAQQVCPFRLTRTLSLSQLVYETWSQAEFAFGNVEHALSLQQSLIATHRFAENVYDIHQDLFCLGSSTRCAPAA